jgi:signal transduction histidine kinase
MDCGRTERGLRLLASTGAALLGPLGFEETLQRVVRLPLPDLADCSVLFLLEEDRRLHPVALAHVDPEREPAFRDVADRHHPEADDPASLVSGVARTRVAVLADLSPEVVAAGVPDDETRCLGLAFDGRRVLVVPVAGRERVLGVLWLLITNPDHRYDDEDRLLAEELGRRAGLAIEGARWHREVERAEGHQQFLLEASLVLASTLDYRAELEQIAGLAVPRLADWCAIDLVEDDGLIHRLVVVHRDPNKSAVLAELQRHNPILRPTDVHTITRVIASGQSWFDPAVTEARFVGEARDPGHLALLRELGFAAEIVVPLRARGRVLGALTLVLASHERRYDRSDLVVAEDLARRCGMAIDNALLYREGQYELARRRQAEEERRAFVDAVAHDVKNPLGAVSAQAQLIRRRLRRGGPLDTDALAIGIDRIESAVNRAFNLLDEMLDGAHLQAGHPLELLLAPTDLVELARRCAEHYGETTAHHRIHVDSAVTSLVGEWDSARLERVVGNLLQNAIKYSPRGGDVTVTVDCAHHDDGGTWAELSVRDRGIGIPAADLPYLFERFRRGSNVSGRFAGTGIGLSGAKQIVEQHGGSLTVESVEGEGSVFAVRLPL